jgi:hypothetical protein
MLQLILVLKGLRALLSAFYTDGGIRTLTYSTNQDFDLAA